MSPSSISPESPIVIENILEKVKYYVWYKDEDVCTMRSHKDPKARPICIPQVVDRSGCIDAEIMSKILFDAKINPYDYAILLKEVKEAPRQGKLGI